MGWGQEGIPWWSAKSGRGHSDTALPGVIAMALIPESFSSSEARDWLANAEKTLDAKQRLLHQGTCEAALGFMRKNIQYLSDVIHILIHKSLKCTQKPWTQKTRKRKIKCPGSR